MKPFANASITEKQLNSISGEVIDAALAVHRELGPGLLESAYEACLCYELGQRNLKVRTQVGLSITYGAVQIDVGYRIDAVVEDLVVVELKTVATIAQIHQAQLLSYLKLSGSRLGLLINFHVPLLKFGIRRLVNNF